MSIKLIATAAAFLSNGALVGIVSIVALAAAPSDPGLSLKNGIITFTFDDARRSQHEQALPIMQKYRLKGTLYLQTGSMTFAGEAKNSWAMSWPEIEDWKKIGWELGAHTVTHPDLTVLNDEQLERELGYSAALIYRQANIFPTSFAFPYGKFNDQVIAKIQKLFASSVGGWIGTEKHGGGFNALTGVDPYRVARFEVMRDTPAEDVCDLVKKASNEHYWLVLVMHQIVRKPNEGPDGTYGVPVAHLASIAECVAQAVLDGVLQNATVTEALSRIPHIQEGRGVALAAQ